MSSWSSSTAKPTTPAGRLPAHVGDLHTGATPQRPNGLRRSSGIHRRVRARPHAQPPVVAVLLRRLLRRRTLIDHQAIHRRPNPTSMSAGLRPATNGMGSPFRQEMRSDYPLIFGVTAAICVVFRLLTIKIRGGGHCTLSPGRFVFAEGLVANKGSRFEVAAVADESPGRSYGRGAFKTKISKDYTLSLITMVMDDGKMREVGHSGLYATGGRALRNLVEFYWQHPQHRLELADGRTVERRHCVATQPG